MKEINPVLRDPLRAAMSVCPKGKVLWILCIVLCAGFLMTAGNFCAEMEGASIIALVGTACVLMLTIGAWRTLKGENLLVLLCVSFLAMLAVAAHLGMLDIRPGRMGKVIEPMLSDMWNYEMVTAMAWEDGAWSGVYLLIMALLSRLEGFSVMYAVKLIDMVCQCGAALAVLSLARLRGTKPFAAVLSMFACVLAPTMLFNGGCWAQCDATFVMLTLWGLYLLLREHPLSGCIVLGLALGTKLQSAFIFPLLIVLFMKKKISLRHLLALFAAFFLSQIAIVLDGQGMMAVFTRYAQQLELARDSYGLSDHAPGVYGMMLVASVREFSGMGLYLGIASALLVVFALLRSRHPLDVDILLLAALLLAALLPLILPQMNARCLYLAGLLAFALASTPRRALIALLLEGISLCSYMEAIFGSTLIPMIFLSMAAIAVATLIAYELIERLRRTPVAVEVQS